MPVITALKRVKYHKDRFNLFVGKKFLCTVPDYLVEKLQLKEGVDVPPKIVEEIELESNYFRASETAYRLLTMRPHSQLELRMKMQKRGFPNEVINPVIKKCMENGYLDDREFAEAYVKSRLLSKPRGSRMLMSELRNKGVDREIAGEVISEAMRETSEEELAFNLLQKNRNRLLKQKSVDLKLKIRNFLGYRGFGYDAIRRATDDFLKTIDNEEYNFDEEL
ncbi:MAG TPA: regulatory protein RecX [candidate division Zixibacteria bacterium]|nr:regulatory protein RecX [candidate division Zixibacteria bacterium]